MQGRSSSLENCLRHSISERNNHRRWLAIHAELDRKLEDGREGSISVALSGSILAVDFTNKRQQWHCQLDELEIPAFVKCD